MNNVNEESLLKILLVDDEPANILLLTKMLSAKNYSNIISTLDPNDVVPLYEEHKFDLILLDINMPNMNGYEVLNELKKNENFKNTSVVAVTGDVYPEDLKKGMDAGFSEYLTKPMRVQTLIEVADKALQTINS